MMLFVLILTYQTNKTIQHPYKFAFEETCSNIGKIMVKDYMYKSFKCVQRKVK